MSERTREMYLRDLAHLRRFRAAVKADVRLEDAEKQEALSALEAAYNTAATLLLPFTS